MHMHFVEWLRLIFCFLILILMPSFRLTFFISIVPFEPQIFVCVYIDFVYFLSFLPPILFGLIWFGVGEARSCKYIEELNVNLLILRLSLVHFQLGVCVWFEYFTISQHFPVTNPNFTRIERPFSTLIRMNIQTLDFGASAILLISQFYIQLTLVHLTQFVPFCCFYSFGTLSSYVVSFACSVWCLSDHKLIRK